MKKNIFLKFYKLFGRRKNKEQVLEILDQMENELMLCSQRIDHNIDDTMMCLSQIDNIKSRIHKLKEIIHE